MVTKKTNHLLFLDGLRGVAALYVVINHAVAQYFRSESDLGNTIQNLSINFWNYGHFAVDLFIVLSGFCLMLPVINNKYFLKGGWIHFLKKRLIRILPPYYFAMIFALLLIHFLIGKKTGKLWDISVPVYAKDIVTHIFMIHDFFPYSVYKINGVFWSVAVEFRIYFFFPLLVLLWRKTSPLFTIFTSIIVCYLMYIVLTYAKSYYPSIYTFNSGVNPYLVLFVMGMFAADIVYSSEKISQLVKLPWSLFTILFAILAIIFSQMEIYYHFKPGGLLTEFKDIAAGISCSGLLVYISKKSNRKTNWIHNILIYKPLELIGTFAYSIYLIHEPILQLLTQYFVNRLHLSAYSSAWLLIVLGTVIVMPTSYLFFIFFERPFLMLIRKPIKIETIINSVP